MIRRRFGDGVRRPVERHSSRPDALRDEVIVLRVRPKAQLPTDLGYPYRTTESMGRRRQAVPWRARNVRVLALFPQTRIEHHVRDRFFDES